LQCTENRAFPVLQEQITNDHEKEDRLQRPNCLNFKNIAKRNEALTFIKSLNFSVSKLIGIAEMKGK